jgi:hypothetical protein
MMWKGEKSFHTGNKTWVIQHIAHHYTDRVFPRLLVIRASKFIWWIEFRAIDPEVLAQFPALAGFLINSGAPT